MSLARLAAGASHREALAAVEDAGWDQLGTGDWSRVFRSPDDTRAARVCPFDPGYLLHARACTERPGNPFF